MLKESQGDFFGYETDYLEQNDAGLEDSYLVDLFYRMAVHQVDLCVNQGWHWTTNYIREAVRGKFGVKFSNTRSPALYRELVRKHPELAMWIDLGSIKVK